MEALTFFDVNKNFNYESDRFFVDGYAKYSNEELIAVSGSLFLKQEEADNLFLGSFTAMLQDERGNTSINDMSFAYIEQAVEAITEVLQKLQENLAITE